MDSPEIQTPNVQRPSLNFKRKVRLVTRQPPQCYNRGNRPKFPRHNNAAPRTKWRVRVCLIFNPTANGDKARRLQRHLDVISADCTLKQTRAAGAARKLAAEAVREEYDVVVAAGGDGTLNEVVNGIVDEPGGLESVRLGVLPLGTINVFAREFGIPIDLKQAWNTVMTGADTEIDLPCVKQHVDGIKTRRYFTQLAGSGLDARAVELVDYSLKKKVGPLAYVFAGIKAIAAPQVKISATNGHHSATGELVLIGNGRYYGGAYPIFHEADPRDGLIDVCVFPKINWGAALKTGWAWASGNWKGLAGAEYFQTRKVKISSNPAAPIEADGEAFGSIPATISIEDKRLKVIVPQQAG